MTLYLALNKTGTVMLQNNITDQWLTIALILKVFRCDGLTNITSINASTVNS